ncbi:MAG: 5-methyltetrahydropteroyltriglutamate--homocysteine S-methyltransferase [Alphaproteobacteria bacterium]
MALNPPFRADHVGSLIRPPEVIEARHRLRDRKLTESELRVIEDKAIREVVKLQEDLGFQVVTDGEYRRGAFFSHFVKTVDGMTVKETPYTFANDSGDRAQAFAPYAQGKLKRAKGITTDEFKFVHGITDRVTKVTLPAPPYVNFLGGRERVDAKAYPNMRDYWADLAAVYREELTELGKLGCKYVQLDEVPLAMMEDPKINATIKSLGEDPDKLIDSYIDTIGEAVRDKPKDMIVGLHLCRGNYRGKWLATGGYGRVAERLFALPNIESFFLEYDSPRAGDFSPLRHLPKGKIALLGLISSKTSAMEDETAIKKRIDEAAKHASLDRLGLCPQCGFATNLTGSPMTVEDEKKKLALVVKIAGDVWGK